MSTDTPDLSPLSERDLAIIETEAIYLPDLEARPFLQFFPFAELNGDITNWFAPNLAAVKALCNAAGFRSVEVSSDYPPPGAGASGSAPCNYRLTVHARR